MDHLLAQKIVCCLAILFNTFCIIYPQYVRGKFTVNNWDDPDTDFNDPGRKRSVRITHSIILVILLFVAYLLFWKGMG